MKDQLAGLKDQSRPTPQVCGMISLREVKDQPAGFE
jgi:hypothetical protein